MMADNGHKLTRRQTVALATLLSSPTVAKAAEKAEIGERTLRLWLSQPAFRHAYEDAKRELLGQTVALLCSAATQAVEALQRNLTAERPSDQIRAAAELLGQVVRLREHGELEERVRGLEERLAEQGSET
jgi:hypothetical protein